MKDAKDRWRLGVYGAAALVLACSPPEPGDEDGGEGASETTEPWFRGGVAEAPEQEDIAAPLRLRVGEESRAKMPLLVFSPAQLPDETIEGVLLVVGGELTAESGQLRGVEETQVEEIDGVVEITPATRAGQLPRIPLEEPWTDLGRAATRLARVNAAVEALQLDGYETALWVVRGRVRVLSGPIEVTARDFFWAPEDSRILLPGEEELPLKLGPVKPRPPTRPPGKLGAVPGERPPGPGVGGSHGQPGGDPAAPSGGALDGTVTPTGPSGHVPGVFWPVWPNRPMDVVVPVPAEEDGPGDGGPAEAPVSGGPAVLLGEGPVFVPPAPEPQVVECTDSSECSSGRCILAVGFNSVVQSCRDECADGTNYLCVDSAGCCNIDMVCTEAGTCTQPGTSDQPDESSGGGGCGDDNGCASGCNDPYKPGCGNGLNEGCNSIGEGCNNGIQGCGDVTTSCTDACSSGIDTGAGACGDIGEGCGGAADGCGDAFGGCGDAFGGCGDAFSCRIDQASRGAARRPRTGRGTVNWFCWLVVFLVVNPRRRRRIG